VEDSFHGVGEVEKREKGEGTKGANQSEHTIRGELMIDIDPGGRPCVCANNPY
jgi:hypothetical protein